MKYYFLFFLLFIFSATSLAQVQIKDSLFVRIDQLKPSKLTYHVEKGNIFLIQVDIKNKYVNTAGFILAHGNSDLALKNKKEVEKKVISYSTFNKMLNQDFLNIYLYTNVYFVLSESKADYLALMMRPILPGQLDIQ